MAEAIEYVFCMLPQVLAPHRCAGKRPQMISRGDSMHPMEGLRVAMKALQDWYKERGIFQGQFGFGKRPALVVIDMAYGWTDPAYAGGSARLDSAVEAIARLLPVARA